jgi:hypothetical protein
MAGIATSGLDADRRNCALASWAPTCSGRTPPGIRLAPDEPEATPVPELSRFFGIVIAMHYNDHVPPHFHARYGSDLATIGIRELAVLEGRLPPRVLGLAIEWAAQHTDELLANWARAARRRPLVPIAPLE